MSKVIDLTFYAQVKKEDDSYLVAFRDFDNIFTEGDTLEEALKHAQEALDRVLMEMAKGDYEIPLPSAKRPGDYPIPLSPDVAACTMANKPKLPVFDLDSKKAVLEVKSLNKLFKNLPKLEDDDQQNFEKDIQQIRGHMKTENY